MSDRQRWLDDIGLTVDLHPENLLHGVAVRSPVPRARLNGITIPPLPEGIHVVTAAEIPGLNGVRVGDDTMPSLAAKEMCYVGQPIALLCGSDLERLGEILPTVQLDYTQLDPVLNPEAAETVSEIHVDRGDWQGRFNEASRIVRGDYQTGYQDELGSDVRAAVAMPADRDMVIFCATSRPFAVREHVSALLKIPTRRVRVVVPRYEGIMGAGTAYPAFLAGHAALLALITRQPVKISYTQKQCLAFTPKRHPALIQHRTALDPDGNVAAMDVRVTLDAGAYTVMDRYSLEGAAVAACGAYKCDASHVHARLVTTNRAPSGDLAGRGEPQAFHAAELHMSRIIAEFQQEPVDWRSRHLIGPRGQLATGARVGDQDPRLVVEDVVSRSDFRRKYAAYAAAAKRGRTGRAVPTRGIGLAVAFHGVGLPESHEQKTRSAVQISLDTNKKLRIRSSLGADRNARLWIELVARILDAKTTDVILEPVDTGVVPDSGPGVGSRAAGVVQSLIERCCDALREDRLRSLPPLEVKRSGRPTRRVAWTPQAPEGDAYRSVCWEATVVEIEVDPLTCEARTRGIWTTLDSGTPGPRGLAVAAGSIIYNLDYLLLRKGTYRGGHWREAAPGDHPMLGVRDIPPISVHILEGPRSAMGDLPSVAVAPAGAAAIEQALGMPVPAIPVSALAIDRLLQSQEGTSDAPTPEDKESLNEG